VIDQAAPAQQVVDEEGPAGKKAQVSGGAGAPGLAVRILPYVLAFFSSLCIMILELVASRLVARHVGASLSVWTSVIGIMLGGICLGNVLGGRLADRVDPGKAIGPLYGLGAFLTLSCLWMNAVVGLTPGLESLSWNLRTVLVVTLDFLVPATVLGMIGPVVAKIAVTHAKRSGSAIGDVYFMGAVGSIMGTFLAGFILMYLAPISTIVTLVAAALTLLAAALIGDRRASVVGLLAGALLGVGSIVPLVWTTPMRGITLGTIPVNPVALAGHVLTVALAVLALLRLRAIAGEWTEEMAAEEAKGEKPRTEPEVLNADWTPSRPTLSDLAALSFVASLTFMALEMVAGRMVSRHLGSSVYGWTSVIGVLLGGLSLGNFLGGKIADHVHKESHASWLFMVASIFTLSILVLETPPNFHALTEWLGDRNSILSQAITLTKLKLPGGRTVPMEWWARVLLVTTIVFLLPSIAMGTVSPLVAKLAVERVRRSDLTGRAIGQVYAWGMVGSILGTFLAGFVLIDLLGTKGLVLILGTALAMAATMLGSIWHAAWAGIPLGLCVLAFFPGAWFEKQGTHLGLREEKGDPNTTEDAIAWVDESDYYFIKVSNEPDADGQKRTLVLDNLIHGYFILGHPERLDYDYEHIYALVTKRVAQAKAGQDAGRPASKLSALFLGGGAYTFQRYVQHAYPGTPVDVAEIDPAVTNANHKALGLPRDTPINTIWGDARQFVEKQQDKKQYDLIYGDAFNDFSVPWHLTTREFNEKLNRMLSPVGVYMINIIDVYESDDTAKEKARREIDSKEIKSPAAQERIKKEHMARARGYGGFLGAWVNTAKLTFPHVAIFGTDDNPGAGLRETFVVVASKQPIKMDDLGSRDDDPQFFQDDRLFEPRPFGAEHVQAIDLRSRGIVLSDDFAPVENLLAPVAATRGED
jgi:MFS family permease